MDRSTIKAQISFFDCVPDEKKAERYHAWYTILHGLPDPLIVICTMHKATGSLIYFGHEGEGLVWPLGFYIFWRTGLEGGREGPIGSDFQLCSEQCLQ